MKRDNKYYTFILNGPLTLKKACIGNGITTRAGFGFDGKYTESFAFDSIYKMAVEGMFTCRESTDAEIFAAEKMMEHHYNDPYASLHMHQSEIVINDNSGQSTEEFAYELMQSQRDELIELIQSMTDTPADYATEYFRIRNTGLNMIMNMDID